MSFNAKGPEGVKKTLGYHERRSVLQQAAALLSEEADSRDFRPAYGRARMNPGAKLRYNSGALEGHLLLTNSGSLAGVREIIDAFKRHE